ncbi:hypothetical protein BZG79_11995 [Salinivibrio sp. MA427]|uniref:Imm50 family immunity protein n=1 Tax=Salinivibrio sp. MA427 TaxID=1909455 RepID=UPI00098A710A|nr:Imm50 family immunity protein [Salinivibrio sp. MA427]OOF08566.1 hypothetical protein BZG79_11995 [Salinivibrio sp. MA427]
MYWNELDGSKLLGKVFSYPVKVDKVELVEVSIKRDGPTVLIRFDLVGKIPDRPTKKWGEFNCCQCGINCSGVYDLMVKNVSRKMVCDIVIDAGEHRKVHLVSEDRSVEVSFFCDHIQFMGPSVYLNE